MINLSKIIITEAEKTAVLEVLDSGMLAQGPKVREFEKNFAKSTGSKYVLAVSNGTAALHIALFAAGIGPGDEVITTPFTFVATANSILMAGATPVFVDIDEKTFNLDPKKIEKEITKKTKAILPVNLYGQPADYKALRQIADKHHLLIIEDAAQSVGAAFKGKMSGTLGDIATFSLYATKNITTGEGGFVTTDNEEWYEKAKLFRHHGQSEKTQYEYVMLGYNYRMTDIQAAIGIEQIKRLKKINGKRQQTAIKYNEAFKNIKGIIVPYIDSRSTHVFHQYTLRITEDFKYPRDEFREKLAAKGIQTNIYYPKPLYEFNHLQTRQDKDDFKNTEKIFREVVSLPVHPYLSSEEIEFIIKTIQNL